MGRTKPVREPTPLAMREFAREGCGVVSNEAGPTGAVLLAYGLPAHGLRVSWYNWRERGEREHVLMVTGPGCGQRVLDAQSEATAAEAYATLLAWLDAPLAARWRDCAAARESSLAQLAAERLIALPTATAWSHLPGTLRLWAIAAGPVTGTRTVLAALTGAPPLAATRAFTDTAGSSRLLLETPISDHRHVALYTAW